MKKNILDHKKNSQKKIMNLIQSSLDHAPASLILLIEKAFREFRLTMPRPISAAQKKPSFLFLMLALLAQTSPVRGCLIGEGSIKEIYLREIIDSTPILDPGFFRIVHVLSELKIDGACGYQVTQEQPTDYDFLDCLCPVEADVQDYDKRTRYMVSLSGKNNSQTSRDCVTNLLQTACRHDRDELVAIGLIVAAIMLLLAAGACLYFSWREQRELRSPEDRYRFLPTSSRPEISVVSDQEPSNSNENKIELTS